LSCVRRRIRHSNPRRLRTDHRRPRPARRAVQRRPFSPERLQEASRLTGRPPSAHRRGGDRPRYIPPAAQRPPFPRDPEAAGDAKGDRARERSEESANVALAAGAVTPGTLSGDPQTSLFGVPFVYISTAMSEHLRLPKTGERIGFEAGKIVVPDNPIIPFIEGDGTGPDIWRATQYVIDGTLRKVYGGRKCVAWYEVYAGDKANALYSEPLPQETVDALRHYRVSIKGPLSTPIGGGIRSLNVTMRQVL